MVNADSSKDRIIGVCPSDLHTPSSSTKCLILELDLKLSINMTTLLYYI
jgi:hypothetical protein